MSLLQIFTHCNYTEMLANFINNCKLEQNTKLYIPGISSEAKFNEIRDIFAISCYLHNNDESKSENCM